MGCLCSDVVVSVTIRTVKHKTWQAFNFPVSQTLLLKVVEILCKQKKFEFLKDCNDLYCNSWFLMKKRTADEYWKVNAVTKLNKIIKWDVNLSPFVNAFSKKFAEMHYASFVDMFSEYNQISLNPCSCNLTAIQTSIRLLRRIQLPQKMMNSVAQFVWIILWMLEV